MVIDYDYDHLYNIILENFEDGKDEGQHWIKGEPNAEGYFTLENSKASKFLTATSLTTGYLTLKCPFLNGSEG